MSEKSVVVQGLSLETWEAMFRPGMTEFAASCFTFSREDRDLVRIAFGNKGPVLDEAGTRRPMFTHAVTLPPEIAVELARLLLKSYAEPALGSSKTSGEP